MKKPDLEAQLKLGHDLVGALVKDARFLRTGDCVFCGESEGSQHKEDCHLMPLIRWHQANHDKGLFGENTSEGRATLKGWMPKDCLDRNSCHKHGECMYVGCSGHSLIVVERY